jgi:hypothetical protein
MDGKRKGKGRVSCGPSCTAREDRWKRTMLERTTDVLVNPGSNTEAERMRSDKDGDKHEPDPFRLLILLPSVRLVELELAKSSGSDVVVDDLGPYQQHVSELERIKAEGAPSAVPSWLNRLTGTWILFPVRLSVTVSV